MFPPQRTSTVMESLLLMSGVTFGHESSKKTDEWRTKLESAGTCGVWKLQFISGGWVRWASVFSSVWTFITWYEPAWIPINCSDQHWSIGWGHTDSWILTLGSKTCTVSESFIHPPSVWEQLVHAVAAVWKLEWWKVTKHIYSATMFKCTTKVAKCFRLKDK